MENDTPFKKALPALQNVYLSAEEKSAMRLRLVEHMRANPRKVSVLREAILFFSLRPVGALMLALLVFLSSGGAAAFAAGGSLPGDMLYPVKTYMNEPVVGFFKGFSLPEKVAFEWELVERRLVEAEQLAEDVLMTQKEAIRTNFTKQRTRAEDLARKLLEQEGTRVAVVTDMSISDDASESASSEVSPAQSLAKAAPKAKNVTPAVPVAANGTADAGMPMQMMTMQAIEPEETGSVSAEPTADLSLTADATSTGEAPALLVETVTAEPFVERMQVTEIGERVFAERDRIFERHQDIIRRLELPLPYTKAIPPIEPSLP